MLSHMLSHKHFDKRHSLERESCLIFIYLAAECAQFQNVRCIQGISNKAPLVGFLYGLAVTNISLYGVCFYVEKSCEASVVVMRALGR